MDRRPAHSRPVPPAGHRPRAGGLYDYDAYTLPGYRGRGVFQAGGACAFAHYRAEGYRRMVALVAEENDAGLRTLVGMGFRVVGRLSAVLLGPWQRDRREQWGEDPVPTPVRGSSGA